MNLENTKIYTTDPEVIRKYAALCGVPFRGSDAELYSGKLVGVSFVCDFPDRVDWFSERSECHNNYKDIPSINIKTINNLYDEKFGKVKTKCEAAEYTTKPIEPPLSKDKEYILVDANAYKGAHALNEEIMKSLDLTKPFKFDSVVGGSGFIDNFRSTSVINYDRKESLYFHEVIRESKFKTPEVFDIMTRDNEQLQEHEVGELEEYAIKPVYEVLPALDVDGRIFTADDVLKLLKSSEAPNSSEWKIGDLCVVDNKDTDLYIVDGCEPYMGQEAEVVYLFINSKARSMALVEFDNGACFAFDVCMLSKPETPEQREERERLEAIKQIQVDMDFSGSDYAAAKRLYDAGYRKQKDGE